MTIPKHALLAAALTLVAPAAVAAQPAVPALDPAVAAATFDSAWSIINRTFWDTTFHGVDWRGARDELRPRAEAARTNAELRAIIQGMLDRLGASHLVVIPGEAAEALAAPADAPAGDPGDAGLELRWVEGALLVTRVVPGGAGEAAGVKTGWAVEAAGAVTAERIRDALSRLPEAAADPRRYAANASAAMEAALRGAAGDTVRARFRDGADRTVEVPLVLRPPVGRLSAMGNLPPILARVEAERVTSGGASVGIIRFPIWLPAVSAELDQAVDGLRDADGIVVDLRGNPGGVAGMAPGFAGHFVNRRDTLGTMTTRRDRVHLVINPRRVTRDARAVTPFAGPVAVLVDERTASTSEFFAGGLQALGRVRVFGVPSSGQALPAMMPRLPNGDMLMHAIADFTGSGGARWEADGVVPDTRAPATRAALLAGGDPALDAALAWIAAQPRPAN